MSRAKVTCWWQYEKRDKNNHICHGVCVYVLSFIKPYISILGWDTKNIALPVLFLITVDEDGQKILSWAALAIDFGKERSFWWCRRIGFRIWCSHFCKFKIRLTLKKSVKAGKPWPRVVNRLVLKGNVYRVGFVLSTELNWTEWHL